MPKADVRVIPEKYHGRIDALLEELDGIIGEAFEDAGKQPAFFDFTPKQRDKLHVLACSLMDYTFWIEKQEDGKYRACEVESGVSGAPADTPREAMENYWEGRY
jgi:hypothetical protein